MLVSINQGKEQKVNVGLRGLNNYYKQKKKKKKKLGKNLFKTKKKLTQIQ